MIHKSYKPILDLEWTKEKCIANILYNSKDHKNFSENHREVPFLIFRTWLFLIILLHTVDNDHRSCHVETSIIIIAQCIIFLFACSYFNIIDVIRKLHKLKKH